MMSTALKINLWEFLCNQRRVRANKLIQLLNSKAILINNESR